MQGKKECKTLRVVATREKRGLLSRRKKEGNVLTLSIYNVSADDLEDFIEREIKSVLKYAKNHRYYNVVVDCNSFVIEGESVSYVYGVLDQALEEHDNGAVRTTVEASFDGREKPERREKRVEPESRMEGEIRALVEREREIDRMIVRLMKEIAEGDDSDEQISSQKKKLQRLCELQEDIMRKKELLARMRTSVELQQLSSGFPVSDQKKRQEEVNRELLSFFSGKQLAKESLYISENFYAKENLTHAYHSFDDETYESSFDRELEFWKEKRGKVKQHFAFCRAVEKHMEEVEEIVREYAGNEVSFIRLGQELTGPYDAITGEIEGINNALRNGRKDDPSENAFGEFCALYEYPREKIRILEKIDAEQKKYDYVTKKKLWKKVDKTLKDNYYLPEVLEQWKKKTGVEKDGAVARMCGVTKGFVSKIMSRKNMPSHDKVAAFAIGFRMTLEEVKELYKAAEYTFSPQKHLCDRVLSEFIEKGNYDVDKFNAEMVARGGKPICASRSNRENE